MANPVWCLSAVEPRTDYTMLLTFENGEKRIYDAKPLLKKKLCEPLKDISYFMCARVEYGTVVWSEDIDIAPEYLYEEGVPVS